MTTDETLLLAVGGDRLRDLELDADDILARWSKELAAADNAIHTNSQPRPITLAVRHRSWSVEAMTRFVPFIESIASRVVALEADDIIASQETKDGYQVMHMLAQALIKAANLRRVNLNDNALGPPTLENMRGILTPRLTSVTFYNCGVDTECMRILRESLLGIDHKNNNNNENNYNNNSDDAVCDLEELDCSRNTIGVDGAEQIGLLLPHCPNLKVFIYAGARPGPVGSKYIADGFQRLWERRRRQLATESGNADSATSYDANLQLQVLNLSEFSFGKSLDQPLGLLCKTLRGMPHLKTFILNDCGLKVSSLEFVVDALVASNAQLEQLNLEDVGEMGVQGGQRLASLLNRYTSTLRVLNLEGNELGWRGLRALTPFFKACSTLQTVNLTRNDLGPRAAKELLSLSTTKWQTLVLEDNWLEDEDLQEQIQQQFPNTLVVFGDQEEGDEEEEEEEEERDEGGDNDNEPEDGTADELTQQLEHLNL